MSNRYSLNKLVVTATFLAVVAAAPLWATEYKPATEECKACVTRCVMNETGGKVFDACFTPIWIKPPGDCNLKCPDVNRNILRSELWKAAREKCETDLASCLQAAKDDRNKILRCRGEEASCKQRTSRFMDPK
ncbi:hypothetical protein [Trichlorobacter lovleyi]|uniref:Uncharacterized protein n=1 Tax=Trichlorobacter lovleyi (strain ATCC BAA-1151 / DSM 17278 / SZ) TaxID=398767 RepID=B3E4D4_TRIL1|nr:hypothetical protein [Trichlorobacter lovleyi]ACD94449.1 hypothetical protein Glov_0723 [Trichlorobacter lovleyi SZ]